MKAPTTQYVARLVDLTDPAAQHLWNVADADEARLRLLGSTDGDAARLPLEGSFALVARDPNDPQRVLLARSLDRPLRYFLAKEASGPMLVVSERIDEIRDFLETQGYADQFHPSYTRMVPAHHVTELALIGCPDPNPVHRRFFDPPRAVLPADLDLLGERYVSALYEEVTSFLDTIPADEPLGVMFSGGVDSGSVLLALYRALLDRGESPARLKAFTLDVAGGGSDASQAREFLAAMDLKLFGEVVEVPADAVDPLAAVEVIEDYKARDVEAAAMTLALAEALRERYPDWTWLVDGDGGDENLKDYPIEENPELTIRSVVNNSMLYQEGWGVDAIKHSLTYSGGLSRGCVRGYAPLARHGFRGFSPYTRPKVVAVAEAIPFAELTNGSHEALYRLKGDLVRRGVKTVLGLDMPVFPKKRFQYGAASDGWVADRLSRPEAAYRAHFLARHG